MSDAFGPYLLEQAAEISLTRDVAELDQRVANLRATGKLSTASLQQFYGRTRFEQIAESNAIEGSTLDVGETELAILKGVTLTGHDPQYVRDARQLDLALKRLTELARSPQPTSITELKELHELILGDRASAGHFRSTPVSLRGQQHKPPPTWKEVMHGMEAWEAWSASHLGTSPVVRSAVLHAWLTHIHPFEDGNGRTGRAIGNLEFIRAGYPPIIIKRNKHRDRYMNALAASDEGNLGPFLDLILERERDALRDLEKAVPDYNPAVAKIRNQQQAALHVWTAATDLLFSLTVAELTPVVEKVSGELRTHRYREALSLDDYLALCQGVPISDAWAFRIERTIPGLGRVVRLAWFGYRSPKMKQALHRSEDAPSIFWSRDTGHRYPPWELMVSGAPGGEEITLVGDRWHVLKNGAHRELESSAMAHAIATDLIGG